MSVLTELNELEFDLSLAKEHSAVKIDDTHIFLAYSGTSNDDSTVKVFSVDGSYNLTEESTLSHTVNVGNHHHSIKIDDTHYAVAYYEAGVTDLGYIKIFEIDPNDSYSITQLEQYTIDATTDSGKYPAIQIIDKVGNDYNIIVVYEDELGNGWIQTVSLNSSTWNISKTTEVQHDSGNNPLYTQLEKITENTFILSYYESVSGDGWLKVITVDSEYTPTEESSLEYDTSSTARSSIAIIDSTHFLLAYMSTASTEGTVETFSMDASTYALASIDSLVHESTYFNYPSLISSENQDNVFVLTYASSTDGDIKTFLVDDSYNVTEENSLTYYTSTYAVDNSLVQIDDWNYANFFKGNSNDGYVSTFNIEAGEVVISPLVTITTTNETPSLNFNRIIDVPTLNITTTNNQLDAYVSLMNNEDKSSTTIVNESK